MEKEILQVNTLKPSITFVGEKWCDGNPGMLESDIYQTYYLSAIECGIFSNVTYLYTDESYLQGNHIDNILLNIKNPSDYYAFTYIGDHPVNPTPLSLEKLGGKKIFLWQDTVWPWIHKLLKETNKFANLQTCFDIPEQAVIDSAEGNLLSLPAPQSTKLFFPLEKTIEASFMGTLYPQRIPFINAFLQSKVPITQAQGKRVSRLPIETYAKIMQKSKISINIPVSPSGKLQLKNRVFESLACRCLLIEGKNDQTRSRLVPGIDYVEYNDIKNMIELIEFYSYNDTERNTIAERGYQKYLDEYSGVAFWKKIIKYVQ